eukprot:GHVP01034673.1.p1 GENE.GHVP01034673.1~~GHVP01034673.1.p1  ORF type:complete len:659 (-),score=189.88 GHVP01034673.1:267-2243(-)
MLEFLSSLSDLAVPFNHLFFKFEEEDDHLNFRAPHDGNDQTKFTEKWEKTQKKDLLDGRSSIISTDPKDSDLNDPTGVLDPECRKWKWDSTKGYFELLFSKFLNKDSKFLDDAKPLKEQFLCFPKLQEFLLLYGDTSYRKYNCKDTEWKKEFLLLKELSNLPKFPSNFEIIPFPVITISKYQDSHTEDILCQIEKESGLFILKKFDDWIVGCPVDGSLELQPDRRFLMCCKDKVEFGSNSFASDDENGKMLRFLGRVVPEQGHQSEDSSQSQTEGSEATDGEQNAPKRLEEQQQKLQSEEDRKASEDQNLREKELQEAAIQLQEKEAQQQSELKSMQDQLRKASEDQQQLEELQKELEALKQKNNQLQTDSGKQKQLEKDLQQQRNVVQQLQENQAQLQKLQKELDETATEKQKQLREKESQQQKLQLQLEATQDQLQKASEDQHQLEELQKELEALKQKNNQLQTDSGKQKQLEKDLQQQRNVVQQLQEEEAQQQKKFQLQLEATQDQLRKASEDQKQLESMRNKLRTDSGKQNQLEKDLQENQNVLEQLREKGAQQQSQLEATQLRKDSKDRRRKKQETAQRLQKEKLQKDEDRQQAQPEQQCSFTPKRSFSTKVAIGVIGVIGLYVAAKFSESLIGGRQVLKKHSVRSRSRRRKR